MAFGGLKKIIRKNKKGFTKLVKRGAGIALSAAAPVIASRLASTASGIVQRAVTAPARRKAAKAREGQINKALAAEIARPQLAMMASKETSSATHGPGGQRVPGGGRKKSTATFAPGGSTVAAVGKAFSAKKGAPLGISGRVGEFVRGEVMARTASQKNRAAQRPTVKAKRQAASTRKSAAAEERKLKAQERKAAAAAKKAEKAAAKAASGGGKPTAVQALLGSALGVKLGKTKTARAATARLAGRIGRGTKAAAMRAVKGKGKNLIPFVGTTSAILGAGSVALNANARAQIRKAEKKLGRKLTTKEATTLTTPVNTFSGK